MVTENDGMVCQHCGADLRDFGVIDVECIESRASMRYDEYADAWEYQGRSEFSCDSRRHRSYECGECGAELTPDQQKVVAP